jgi:formylglycine-generating enzyme required for sulfatase activity
MSNYGITQSGSSGSFTYSVTTGFESKPVVWVSWFDAARFSNWLGNGQGNASTEDGAYTILGSTSGIITVNTGAIAWIPTENEWYKAAYYNAASQNYAAFANGQNSLTKEDANFDSSGTTDVGTYSSDPSFYGTFDQAGNVWEWNDAVISGFTRGLRGGSWLSADSEPLLSWSRNDSAPSNENDRIGFRLASVPEPSAMALSILAIGMMLIRRKR